MPRKNYVSGFGEQDPDAAAFLKPDNTDPINMGDASGHGYNARWDDDSGARRGAEYGFSNSVGDKSFLSPSQTQTYDAPENERFADLIDSAEGMGSGNALTGGGGPLTQRYGIGSGKRRYPAKGPGPQSNGGL
jgi:hypothetical protein